MSNKQDKKRPIWVQVLLDKSISPAGRLVFSYLFWRQGSNGSSWPSQFMIAEDLGLTRRSVRKITKRLEDRSYIQVIRPENPGRGQYLQYSILDPPRRGNVETPFRPKKGERRDPLLKQEGGTKRPKKGERRDPLTLRENTKRVGGKNNSQKTCVEKSLLPLAETQDLTTSKMEHPKAKPAKQKTNRKRDFFKPPTAQEVRAYADTIDYYTLSAEGFVDWYASKGWMVGKNKMKDWRAAVRTWKQRDEAAGKKTGSPKRGEPGWLPTEEYVDELFRETGLIK